MHPTQQGRGKGETGDEDNCPIPIQGPRVGREAVPVACGDTIPEATFISGMAITLKLPNGRSFLLRARGCGSLATWQIRTAEMERSKRQLYLPFHMWPPGGLFFITAEIFGLISALHSSPFLLHGKITYFRISSILH